MLNKTETLAIKRDAAGFLASLPDRDPSALAVHQLGWGELNSIERDARSYSRRVIELVKDDTPQGRGSELETCFDALSQIADACKREKDGRTERGDRNPHEGIDLSKRPIPRSATAHGVDMGRHEEDNGDNWELKPQQRFKSYAQARSNDHYSGLSAGRLLRAMVVGAQTDHERRALSEGTDSAGGFTVPEVLSAELIDLLRAQSVVIAAGARTVPLTSNKMSVAKLATDPVPTWRTENSSVTESEPTFAQMTFEPKSLAVMTKVSFELMADSINISRELPRILAAALAQELDRVALLGAGSSPEPLGVINMSGISTEALGGVITNYASLVSARTALLTANVGAPTAMIMHPRDEGKFAGLTDTTGQPLNMPSSLNGVRMLTTTKIAIDGGVGSDESTIFVGNFSKLLIGMRQSIRVELLKERFADSMQYGLVAHLRADIQAEHTAAFHTITGVQG
jgi:HK97 family phage major capsid protein